MTALILVEVNGILNRRFIWHSVKKLLEKLKIILGKKFYFNHGRGLSRDRRRLCRVGPRGRGRQRALIAHVRGRLARGAAAEGRAPKRGVNKDGF